MNRALAGAPLPPLPSLLHSSINPSAAAIDIVSSGLRLVSSTSSIPSLIPSYLFPFIGPSELSSILLRSQSLPLPSFHLLSFLQSRLAFTPSPQHFSLLIHSLAFYRLFSLSLSTLGRFIFTHPSSDPFFFLLSTAATAQCNFHPSVFSLLVTSYLRLGRLRHALDAFRRALNAGFSPDLSTLNFLLSSLSRSGDYETCWGAYAMARSAGVSPNLRTFNIMINALCRADDAARALEFLEEMEIHGFDPDVVTYNTLINGYCRKGRTDEALRLYNLMFRRGIEQDLVSHTILIRALCSEGRVWDARQLYNKMRQRGICPDEICYNALVTGYCRKGMMQEAWAAVQAMIGSGLFPDGFVCLELVKGYANAEKLPYCLNLLAQLRKLGAAITLDAYKLLIRALCCERKPNAARSVMVWMVEDGCKPNVDAYNAIIKSFCDCGLSADAFSLMGEMAEMDVSPDQDTYAILITCLCRLGHIGEAECLMEEMVACGCLPNSAICGALVSGYCSRRELNKAEGLLKYFVLQFGFHDNHTFNALIRVCTEEGGMDNAFDLKNRLLKLGFCPNPETCKLLITGLSRNLLACQ